MLEWVTARCLGGHIVQALPVGLVKGAARRGRRLVLLEGVHLIAVQGRLLQELHVMEQPGIHDRCLGLGGVVLGVLN